MPIVTGLQTKVANHSRRQPRLRQTAGRRKSGTHLLPVIEYVQIAMVTLLCGTRRRTHRTICQTQLKTVVRGSTAMGHAR